VIHGYSDRINHAFAFAAKHHDRRVRQGTRAPYLTQPATVAVILTRYGRGEDEVVAGILHDVVQDARLEAWEADELEERIGAKFGHEMLALALEVTTRRFDADGTELSRDEIRADQLTRIREASASAKWVAAAAALHQLGTLHADLTRTIDPQSVWGRVPGGRDATLAWHDELATALGADFTAPILTELGMLREEVRSL
jgi:(p)ppGpp synthase/HD superfamily hydrolase